MFDNVIRSKFVDIQVELRQKNFKFVLDDQLQNNTASSFKNRLVPVAENIYQCYLGMLVYFCE